MMKLWLGIMIFTGTISMDADGITLGRLFQLWDQATGMRTTLPRELSDRKLSIHFTGLSVNAALRKIFDGQPLGYVVLAGTELFVTERVEPAPISPVIETPQALEQVEPAEPQIVRMKPAIEPPTPTLIPTPFGPMVRADGSAPPTFIQLPPVETAPPPPFFRKPASVVPPAGAPNGPASNNLFGPLSIHQNAPLLSPNDR